MVSLDNQCLLLLADYFLEDCIQMTQFIPPPKEKKKKEKDEESGEDDDVCLTSLI